MDTTEILGMSVKVMTAALEHYTLNGYYTEEEGKFLQFITQMLIQNEEQLKVMIAMMSPMLAPYIQDIFKNQ